MESEGVLLTEEVAAPVHGSPGAQAFEKTLERVMLRIEKSLKARVEP